MSDRTRTGQPNACLKVTWSASISACESKSGWQPVLSMGGMELGIFPKLLLNLHILVALCLSANWLSFPSPLVQGRKQDILNKCNRPEAWQKCKTLVFVHSGCLLLWICTDNCKWLHSCGFNEISVISWYTLTDGLHAPSPLQMQNVAALKMIQVCFTFQLQRAGSMHTCSWLGSADEL